MQGGNRQRCVASIFLAFQPKIAAFYTVLDFRFRLNPKPENISPTSIRPIAPQLGNGDADSQNHQKAKPAAYQERVRRADELRSRAGEEGTQPVSRLCKDSN